MSAALILMCLVKHWNFFSKMEVAIAPLGSTGESAYLSLEEWRQVADFTVKPSRDESLYTVGISELTTLPISKARFAQSIGADAVMIIPVSYWKLTEQEIFDYYREISEAISLLYHGIQ